MLPHPVGATPMIRLAVASGLVVARLMRCSHIRDDLGDWVFPQAMTFISMPTIFFLILFGGLLNLGTTGCLAVYGLDVVLIIDPFSMDIAGKGSRLVRPGMGGGR